MNYSRLLFGWILLACLPVTLIAQRITYSEPDREDVRQLRFDLLGKIGNQYLVYKNTHSKHYISIYDQDMHLIKNTNLDLLNDRLINIDFVPYKDYAYMIYQYEKKGVIYCMGLKIAGDGNTLGEPQLLDTTQVGAFGDNKIYSTVFSEDKSKILVFKMKGRNTDYLSFTTILLDDQLSQMKKTRFVFKVDQHVDMLTDFFVDNDGDFVFGRCERGGARDNIVHLTLAMKPATGDSLQTLPIGMNGVLLDEVKLKIDNFNNRFILNSFYTTERHGNIDGMFTAIVDKAGRSPLQTDTIAFSQQLRAAAKGENSVKGAFNDYFIKHVIVTKDKGFIVTAESEYSSSRGSTWNRYDYLYNNGAYSPYDYYNYSPWSNYGWGPYNRFGYPYYQPVRYYSDDILIFALDQDGKLEWSNVIPKSQFDDDDDSRLSFQIMLQGGALHFLYNEWNRRTPILTDDAVTPDGRLNKQPPLRNLDRGYEFLVRHAKQVNASQMLVPCIYRNSIAFALIDFDAAP